MLSIILDNSFAETNGLCYKVNGPSFFHPIVHPPNEAAEETMVTRHMGRESPTKSPSCQRKVREKNAGQHLEVCNNTIFSLSYHQYFCPVHQSYPIDISLITHLTYFTMIKQGRPPTFLTGHSMLAIFPTIQHSSHMVNCISDLPKFPTPAHICLKCVSDLSL